jgi:hypothetical protein
VRHDTALCDFGQGIADRHADGRRMLFQRGPLAIPAAFSYLNYSDAAGGWDSLPAVQKTQFSAETGLGEQAYKDIVRMKTRPITNSNGTDLTGDARQGLVRQAIMSLPAMHDLLMTIFKGFDKFRIVTDLLIRANLT